MSRYVLTGENPRYRIVVGWDTPLGSFFAQVKDLAFEAQGAVINPNAVIGDTPEEGLLVWLGADSPVTDVAHLTSAIADYLPLPETMLEQLRQDQRASTQ